MGKIVRVSLAHAQEPYAQRHHFWRQYAGQHIRMIGGEGNISA
jgi:hypothetical protein